MEYVVARRQMINQIPHLGFSQISIFVAAISQASGICFRGFGGLMNHTEVKYPIQWISPDYICADKVEIEG